MFNTLRDAVILVAFVVLLFLQNWRSAIIPLVAVPVAIVGTFAVMAALGFSLNNLTLFGLVLAIGIVVDDAIVVVEAVEHHIEHGLAPRDATIMAMSQVSAPVIAVGLVLTAVFIPCAFITGISGQFYRQFALTIATSTVISAFNSLTLSPALSALLLKPREKGVFQALPWPAFVAIGGWAGYALLGPVPGRPGRGAWMAPRVALGVGRAGRQADRRWPPERPPAGWSAACSIALLGWVFYLFNKGFDAATSVYTRMVGGLLRVSVLVLLLYGGLLGLTYWGMTRTPTGFIPPQDKGYLLVNVQLPDSSSLERTQKVMADVERIAREMPGVSHTLAIAGQSILMNANAPNFGAMYVMLDDFHHRAHEGLTGPVIGVSAPGGVAAADQGRAGQRLRGPAGRRPGDRRRLQDRRRGPRRHGLAGDRGRRQPDRRRRRRKPPSPRRSPGCSPASGPTRPGCTWTSTATRPSWPASRSPSCSTPCRSTWARCTSTTSTDSAAPGRSTSRGMPTSASRSAT